jgi:putative transposase
VKYALIDQLRQQQPVTRLCALLDVATSGYQAWSAGKVVPARKLDDLRLVVAIKAAHQRGRGIYGPKKIQSELANGGIVAGLNRIKRLRKQHGIRCMHKKKFRVTTDSRHSLPVAPNLLDRRFADTTAPNQVWVADITYIPTDEGWLYLAAVKDLYTCEIVGWAMDSRMTQTLVADALRAAYWRKKPGPGLLHHSDRGSQYCSHAYRALQVSYGMQTSMSRKGDSWDNAPMESFFGTLKTESLHHYRFTTVNRRSKWCLNILKCFTIESAVMPKSTMQYRLILLDSFTPVRKWRHNAEDLPLH